MRTKLAMFAVFMAFVFIVPGTSQANDDIAQQAIDTCQNALNNHLSNNAPGSGDSGPSSSDPVPSAPLFGPFLAPQEVEPGGYIITNGINSLFDGALSGLGGLYDVATPYASYTFGAVDISELNSLSGSALEVGLQFDIPNSEFDLGFGSMNCSFDAGISVWGEGDLGDVMGDTLDPTFSIRANHQDTGFHLGATYSDEFGAAVTLGWKGGL